MHTIFQVKHNTSASAMLGALYPVAAYEEDENGDAPYVAAFHATSARYSKTRAWLITKLLREGGGRIFSENLKIPPKQVSGWMHSNTIALTRATLSSVQVCSLLGVCPH